MTRTPRTLLIGLLVGPAGLGSIAGAYPGLHYITISNPEAIQPFADMLLAGNACGDNGLPQLLGRPPVPPRDFVPPARR